VTAEESQETTAEIRGSAESGPALWSADPQSANPLWVCNGFRHWNTRSVLCTRGVCYHTLHIHSGMHAFTGHPPRHRHSRLYLPLLFNFGA
jgi:hypothetical protein